MLEPDFESKHGPQYNQIRQYCQIELKRALKQKKKQDAYTVVSSVALVDVISRQVEVISVGFGTKVLPMEIASRFKGRTVKDMHGEMLAKDGFRKFIIQKLPQPQQTSHYFGWDDKRHKHYLRSTFEVVLYSSEIFCGDCMVDEQHDSFSGAKPLKFFNLQSPPNHKYQPNILRTKPGRLDLPQHKKSLSLSCSDKIALWNILGMQGKKLFKLILPIYLDTILLEVAPNSNIDRVSTGINLVRRIANLKGWSEQKVGRKIFNIVIDGKQRKISHQFRHQKPTIITIKSVKPETKKGFQLCGVIMGKDIQWLNGRTGFPEGVSLNQKKMKQSCLCSKQMYTGMEGENPFKYEAIKSRIKMLFGEWTSTYRPA